VAHIQGVGTLMKIAIVIPAYNEAQSIGPLVAAIRAFNYDCLVIDDGSLDATDTVAAQAGAIVLKTGGKSGKGHALKIGFEYVLKNSYDALIAMDGDGQHSPADIGAFVDCYKTTQADIVCGNRMQNPQGMPLVRLMTNSFMSWLISLICRQHIPDTQCGFRLIKTQALRAMTLECSDFEIETEVLIKASKKGFKVVSIGIQSIYNGGVSKINPVRDTFRFLAYLLRELSKKNV